MPGTGLPRWLDGPPTHRAPGKGARRSASATASTQAPSHPLYFDAVGDAIRLSAHAEQHLPGLARALGSTAIASAQENADVEGPHGPAYHVQIATAGTMDLTHLESLAARHTAVDGVMYEPTHVSISFALATPVAPIAAVAAGAEWAWAVFDLRPRAVGLACTRRRAPR